MNGNQGVNHILGLQVKNARKKTGGFLAETELEKQSVERLKPFGFLLVFTHTKKIKKAQSVGLLVFQTGFKKRFRKQKF